MSFRIGYLSANRQLRVRAILSFDCFSVFYCGFGKKKENEITEEKKFVDTKTWNNTRHPSKLIQNNYDKHCLSRFSAKKHATSIIFAGMCFRR